MKNFELQEILHKLPPYHEVYIKCNDGYFNYFEIEIINKQMIEIEGEEYGPLMQEVITLDYE